MFFSWCVASRVGRGGSRGGGRGASRGGGRGGGRGGHGGFGKYRRARGRARSKSRSGSTSSDTLSDERKASSSRYAGANRKRGRPRVDESIKVVRKKTSKKNYNGKMTTLQITKETREKLRVFQDRHKLKSMDHVLKELLKFYPDTGVRTPRNRSVVIPDKSNSDTEPEHNNESLFRMAIIGRLVSELGVSHYMVPLCLAYCDMYFHGKVDLTQIMM